MKLSMSIVEKTLQENYIYFIKELARINEEIKDLPADTLPQKWKKYIGSRIIKYVPDFFSQLK